MMDIYKQKNKKAKNNGPSYKRLSLMSKRYRGMMNEISNPIDATNRFINLALHSAGDNSQERQFLLESKQGIRKTSLLLKKLNEYSKRMEKEILEMARIND